MNPSSVMMIMISRLKDERKRETNMKSKKQKILIIRRNEESFNQ